MHKRICTPTHIVYTHTNIHTSKDTHIILTKQSKIALDVMI